MKNIRYFRSMITKKKRPTNQHSHYDCESLSTLAKISTVADFIFILAAYLGFIILMKVYMALRYLITNPSQDRDCIHLSILLWPSYALPTIF